MLSVSVLILDKGLLGKLDRHLTPLNAARTSQLNFSVEHFSIGSLVIVCCGLQNLQKIAGYIICKPQYYRKTQSYIINYVINSNYNKPQ